jgi:hypothetical protein
MGYSGAWGKLIHEKNLQSKISWHCPLIKFSIFILILLYFHILGQKTVTYQH